MIRLIHLSGSLEGSTFTSEQDVVRIGRSAGCDLRFDGEREPKVSYHHGEIVRDNGAYAVVDTDSETGVLVNGRKVTRHELKSGDRITFGRGGPELRFEVASAAEAREAREEPSSAGGDIQQISSMREQAYRTVAEVSKMSKTLETPEGAQRDETTARAVAVAARKVAEERARAGGQSSGHTMLIMADALEKVKERAQQTSRSKWVRIVAMVAAGAFVVVGVMGLVIYRQRQQLAELVQEKKRIDGEILAIHKQMQQETDPEVLDVLDAKLELLTGNARKKLDELGKTDKAAAQAAEPMDDLDREIRKILKKFNADTYSVPPIFKDRLQYYVDDMVRSPSLRSAYAKKKKIWPEIQKAFAEAQLPEELGYIAWTESAFNPEALNPTGARGMWQFMIPAAQNCGLKVDKKVDERTDVEKSSRAAACHLSKLLVEFGEQSFMLVLASYNKGENGVRRVLHKVAQEPGGFRKRDFWHLYRLKLLPEETREYVPRTLAAAIVLGNPGKYGLE